VNDIVVYFIIGAVLIIAYVGARMWVERQESKGPKIEPFEESHFVEVERPAPITMDTPVAPVFRIAESDLPDPYRYIPRDGLQNYYMTVPGLARHPFLPDMKHTQWVRIVAPDDPAARKIAAHYSGGHYATVMCHEDFKNVRDFFPHGEYECLSSENYWKFLDSEVI